MSCLTEQIPVKLSRLTPLLKLSELLSHKKQFLTRVTHHKGISGFQILKFVIVLSGHLVDHRAFQMDNFIMRQYQNVLLAEGIGHGEGHLIMVEFSEIRIQFHILQEIMHPSHVPLKRESETVLFFHISGYFRPCSRLFSDHHGSFVSSKDQGIQMLEKFNSLQVLVTAIFVCDPLSVFFSIIQVQHGCHCIHTQTVYVELFDPVQSVRDQEILDFVFSIIKDLGTPVRMLSLTRVGMLVDTGSIKLCQSVSIFRKMRRYPVEDDTDLIFM